MKQISIDVGGTFTDCFVIYNDQLVETKALTTHHNLAAGFMNALGQAADIVGVRDAETLIAECDAVRYATTLGTNALIERTGRNVALITTAGYESSVPLSRGKGYGVGMPPSYQADVAAASRPEPLVPIQRIRGVRERIDYKGDVVMALDEADLRSKIRELVDIGAQAFVIAFVNSVVNPEHELLAEEILLKEYPSHMLGSIPVVLSHLVGGRKGEYVRTTSAIVDAYLHDEMFFALGSLEEVLRQAGYHKPMLVVHNTGGMAQVNSTHALQTIHSGPVAGVNASEHVAEHFDLGNVIATDMGGTSFDIGLVVRGGIKFYDFNPIMDRWMVNVPMIHLETLGAGGGSIAQFDRMFKSVQVGPRSAGSDPGPACYDRGGTEPTVTDADLLLGYLSPENYAGGKVRLNERRSRRAFESALCEPLGVDIIEAAKLVRHRVDLNMANAIAEEVRTKGYEPSEFTFLAYGGSGPLHCCGIASELNINRIFVPPFSSVFSALGAGQMKHMHVHEASVYLWLYSAMQEKLLDDYSTVNDTIEELEARGRADLLRQGFDESSITFSVEMDMRYGNQLAETSVECPVRRINSLEDLLLLVKMFSEDYGIRYGAGSQAPEAGIRINSIRVLASVPSITISLDDAPVERKAAARSEQSRPCHFVGHDAPRETAIFSSEVLTPGSVVEGPAIIESPRTTSLIEPGWTMTVGHHGSGWVERA